MARRSMGAISASEQYSNYFRRRAMSGCPALATMQGFMDRYVSRGQICEQPYAGMPA
jgi:hypothetical protein